MGDFNDKVSRLLCVVFFSRCFCFVLATEKGPLCTLVPRPEKPFVLMGAVCSTAGGKSSSSGGSMFSNDSLRCDHWPIEIAAK